MQPPRIHIVGAGLSGLSAAVALAQTRAEIHVHEAARAAGGRCRSFIDPQLGAMIDNGNHLLLSGNRSALAFVDKIGSRDRFWSPREVTFPFVDLNMQRRWRLRPSRGRIPFWLLSSSRRTPGTSLQDHLSLLRLMRSTGDEELQAVISCSGPLYENMLRPVLLAALNTDPAVGSTQLARAVLMESIAKGADYCRPMIAKSGLSHALIDPALEYLATQRARVAFSDSLKSVVFDRGFAVALEMSDRQIQLSREDVVILALPPNVAASLVPGLAVPLEHNAIVNAHFLVDTHRQEPQIVGVVGGLTEWLFTYPDRISVTISAGNALLDVPRQELAERIWREVKAILQIDADLPKWQIIREKRATFSATPKQNALRPAAKTTYSNLILAGDWTATGLPATIEGAVRSGEAAAQVAIDVMKRHTRDTLPELHKSPTARLYPETHPEGP